MKKTFYLTSAIQEKAASKKGKGLRIAGYANTVDKDRQGDVVLPSAWVKGIDNYRLNPVLLFQHKADHPIGRVEKIRVDNRGLYVEALVSEAAEKQHNIHTLIMDNALKSFSVGFRALDGKYNSETEATTITDVELLEVSVVSIPANQSSLFSVRKNFDTEDEYKAFCENLRKEQDAEEYDTKDIIAGITSFDEDHYHSFEIDEDRNGATVYVSHGYRDHTHEIIDNEIQEAKGHTHTVRVVDPVLEEEGEEKSLKGVFEIEMKKDEIEETVKEEELEEETEEEEIMEATPDDPYTPIPFENCLSAETSKVKRGNIVSYNDSRYVVTKEADTSDPKFTFLEVDINNQPKKRTPVIVEATKLSVVNDWDLGTGYDIQLLDQNFDIELTEKQRTTIKEKFNELVNINAKEIYELRSNEKIKDNKSYQEKVNRLLNLKLLSTDEWTDTNFIVANHICDTINKLNEINLTEADDSESDYNFALLLHGHKIDTNSEKENENMATQLVGDPQVVKTDSQPEKKEAPEPRVEVSEPRVAELVEKAGEAIVKEADSSVNDKSSEQIKKELEEIRSLREEMLRQREEIAAYHKSKMEFHEANRAKEQFSPSEMADAYFLAKAMGMPDDERLFSTKLGQRMKAVTTVDQFLSNFSTTVQEEMEQELIIAPMLRRVAVDARNFRVPVADEDTDLNVAQFPSGIFALGVDDTTNVAVSVQNTISAVTFTPHKFMAATHISRDEEEDTVLPLIGFLRAGAARRMARAIDKSLLRGDGSLSGSVTQAPTDYTSVITGMVARAEAVAGDGLKVFTGANATQASALNIATARTAMGKYGLRVNSNDLIYITSVEGYNELVQTADFRTVDTFGPQATYHKGVLGSIWGIPVMISEFMDNKGAATTSNNTVGALIYKPGFLVAERRGIMVETEYEPRQQITAVYMSTRLDMQALTTVASAALSNAYSFAVSIQTGDGTI